jgi:hypothetical protein
MGSRLVPRTSFACARRGNDVEVEWLSRITEVNVSRWVISIKTEAASPHHVRQA